jgi:hypothetical protein
LTASRLRLLADSIVDSPERAQQMRFVQNKRNLSVPTRTPPSGTFYYQSTLTVWVCAVLVGRETET